MQFFGFKHALLLLCISVNALVAQDSSFAQVPDYYRTLATVDKVIATNNLAGNFNPDSVTTLPYGIVKEIGVARYIIAIDSAMFNPGKATFSAYMAIEFPGSTEKLAFAAKNVAFNPKGVIPNNNTRLTLVSEHRIHFGPNITMVLAADGSNYVEWDCNGFKGVKLKGYFEFNRNILTPDTSSAGTNTVKAGFDVYANDIHNFVTQISISSFYIKGLKDLAFSVQDAVVDMSDFVNDPLMTFPPGYNSTGVGQSGLWTGFYIKQLKIKLPKELGKNGSSLEVSATNFLIDKSGISGIFSASNLFATSEGKMGNWPFSIDAFSLNFISNNLVGGSLGGKFTLPMNESVTLNYNALVYKNTVTKKIDYTFSLSPATNYSATVLSAKIDIDPTSKLIVQKIGTALKPMVELNGKITFVHDVVKSAALEMQQVRIKDEAPFLIGGVFSFASTTDSSANKLSGFHISISSISLTLAQNAPAIGFGVGINFTAKADAAFGAQASFLIVSKIENVTQGTGSSATTTKKWSFDKIAVNDIGVSVHTTAFKLDGTLKFKNNDPRYGNGFFGSLSLKIEKVLDNPVSANVWFGNTNKFTYYYFDLAVPFTVVLVPPVSGSPEGIALYRFMGGLYYHMKPATTAFESVLYSPAFGSAQNYIPDSTRALGIKAGVTVGTYPNSSMFNGDVALEVLFTSSGGLGSIKFSGSGFLLVKINDRVPTPKTTPVVKVGFSILYDHQNEIFHMVMNAKVNLSAVSAQGQAELHIDKNTWYVVFGRPYNRVTVNLANVAAVSAYIELGNEVDPIPPPPQEVMSIFGHGVSDSRNQGQLKSGAGLAMGASLGAGSSGSFGVDDFSVYYNLGLVAGFDVMVIDYGPNAHCDGSSGRAGFNGWYAQGDVYAALWGAIGARGHVFGSDFDVQLVSVSAAAMLGGKFPNPSSVSGEVAVNYDFLSVFHGSFDCSFSIGDACSISN